MKTEAIKRPARYENEWGVRYFTYELFPGFLILHVLHIDW